MQAYFGLFWGGPGPKFFLSPFGPKRPNFFVSKIFFLHYFDSQRVWDPQKPKIDPVDPPVDPILAQFVGKRADFGVKKRVFLKIFFCSKSFFIGSQMAWDPQKPKIGPLYPPTDPIWAHFVGILGQFGVKKRVFLKNVFAANHFLSVPRWSGTLKNPKLALYTPQRTPFGRAPALPVATQPACSRT